MTNDAFDKQLKFDIHKLNAYSVRSSILSIVESYLQDHAIKVVLDGQSSIPYYINAGVPQGLVL